MSIVDISALGNLQPVESIDVSETYVSPKVSTFQLPPKGVYTLRAPSEFTSANFTATSKGYLSAQIDPTIVGPIHEGFQIRFVKVSAKTFNRDGSTVSQLGDYLRACGFQGVLKTPADMADAVASTAGRIYQAVIDWRAYSKSTGWSLDGMTKFPSNGDGTFRYTVQDPTPGAVDPVDPTKPLMVRANLVITKFLPLEG